MRLEREGVGHHENCEKGSGFSKPTCLRDRRKRLPKVSSFGTIAHEH